MPLVPERLATRQEVRQGIAAQFWEQQIQSTSTFEGTAKILPCEPPPLTQAQPSGLSRTQQLIVAQSAGLPFIPSFSGDNGGLVSDARYLKQ